MTDDIGQGGKRGGLVTMGIEKMGPNVILIW